jgi:hypothetical protein
VQPPERKHGRLDEPLEVGLARYRKKESVIPPWLVERMGWIGVVVLIFVFGLPIKLLWNFAGGPPPTSQPKTSLILTFGPAKVWKEGTSSHLKSATIKIKNVGSAPALGVEAMVYVRTNAIPLSGPDTLEPGAEATYTGEANVSLLENERLDTSFGCINCAVD